MNFSFTSLRWVFLVIYVILLLVLAGISVSSDPQGTMWVLILAPVILFTQFLMVSATSKVNFCGAHAKNAIWIPAVIGGLLFAILSFGFIIGLAEVLYLNSSQLTIILCLLIPISWIVWAIVFFLRYRGTNPDSATGKILRLVLAGSVLELIAMLPMHILASSRGGCFAGLFTALGLSVGVCVAFWAFGPGIILLFIRHYKKQIEKGSMRG